MKKITLFGLLAVSLYAGGYYNSNNGYYNSSDSNSYKSEPARGMEKPGDNNWENQQIDTYVYGKNNAYQGSRPGDDDWGERNLKHLIEDE